MLNTISSVLAQLGLTTENRAIHIQFSNSSLNQQVYLQRIDGQHGLNQGFKAQLICLANNAHIQLKQFIGCQVAVDIISDLGQLLRSTGIITEAAAGASDGALTIYKLSVEDATSLWQKRRNSRVFMNKSVVEVIETLFKEWQQNNSLFAASLSLDLSGVTQDYDVRPFIMQNLESDYDFLTRLMRQEGISWLIDEAQLMVDRLTDPIQPQKLRLIDDNSQYQALARRSIRFHRSSATERQDSMRSLIAQRSLQPTAVHVQRWQADVLDYDVGAGQVQSTQKHSENIDNDGLFLEQAWHFSPAWMQDLNGADQATASGNRQVERINQNLSNYYNAQSKQFIAQTTVRDAQVGYWFELNEHPEIDSHEGADKEFLIVSKTFYNQNNLPKDLDLLFKQLLNQSLLKVEQDKILNNDAERQGNTLVLQRRNIAMPPEYNPLQHRPAAHPQRARVVGPTGEAIHVDEWGRIKVRFLFARAENHSHDGGAGTNDNDTDSAWVDVLTPWAGEGYGARFLPRVGEIVVIDFFDGNIDRPFVLGRIHEAQRSPTQFDVKGQLPATHKLSGIRSQEIGGGGFGQLRFDDTTGQISSQLQSSHGATQLNLGNLSHPKDQAESDGRGDGFELRTDQWGALRAGRGLLISTHAQDQAGGVHLEASTAKQQLESNLNSAKALSEVAKHQQTDPLETLDQLKWFIDHLSQQDPKKAAEFKSAVMILASADSMTLSAQADLHLSSAGQISHSAGESINLSTQKSLLAHASSKISLFAAQQGARLMAAKGKVEIQAQGDGMDLIARQGIKITSTEDRIEISSPKEIQLTAGGSQLSLNDAGIFFTTNMTFLCKAGQHVFNGGEKVLANVAVLPTLNRNNWIGVEYLDADNQPFAHLGYKLFFENNQIIEGHLDEYGKAHHENVPQKAVKVEYEQEKIKDEPWDTYDLVINELNKLEK